MSHRPDTPDSRPPLSRIQPPNPTAPRRVPYNPFLPRSPNPLTSLLHRQAHLYEAFPRAPRPRSISTQAQPSTTPPLQLKRTPKQEFLHPGDDAIQRPKFARIFSFVEAYETACIDLVVWICRRRRELAHPAYGLSVVMPADCEDVVEEIRKFVEAREAAFVRAAFYNVSYYMVTGTVTIQVPPQIATDLAWATSALMLLCWAGKPLQISAAHNARVEWDGIFTAPPGRTVACSDCVVQPMACLWIESPRMQLHPVVVIEVASCVQSYAEAKYKLELLMQLSDGRTRVGVLLNIIYKPGSISTETSNPDKKARAGFELVTAMPAGGSLFEGDWSNSPILRCEVTVFEAVNLRSDTARVTKTVVKLDRAVFYPEYCKEPPRTEEDWRTRQLTWGNRWGSIEPWGLFPARAPVPVIVNFRRLREIIKGLLLGMNVKDVMMKVQREWHGR